MNKKLNIFSVFVLLLFFSTLQILPQEKNANTIYQTAPIISLLKGVMIDNVSLKELKEHGNYGLGTFNKLNGEMIMVDGKIFRIGSDGKVVQPPDSTKTPFAAVVNFKADKTLEVNQVLNFKQINDLIDKNIPSVNRIYAIKISGAFKSMKTRSPRKQKKSYTDLGSALKHQVTFNLGSVKGTMFGFRFPDYLKNINSSGYHFHFLTSDEKHGGHVLDFVTQKVKIEIEYINNIDIRIPATKDFNKAKLD